MHLPGSRQVGFGKKLLEQFAWHRFRPHPEWAEYADGPQRLGVAESLPTYGPFAAGIPDEVRVIYVPESWPVRIVRLDATASYRARLFDPASGQTSDLGAIVPDDSGTCSVRKLVDKSQVDDWVVIIETVARNESK